MIGMEIFLLFMENGETRYVFLKLFKSAFTKEVFNLNNRGNHFRDFTYIGDIYEMIKRLLYKNTSNHDVCTFFYLNQLI